MKKQLSLQKWKSQKMNYIHWLKVWLWIFLFRLNTTPIPISLCHRLIYGLCPYLGSGAVSWPKAELGVDRTAGADLQLEVEGRRYIGYLELLASFKFNILRTRGGARLSTIMARTPVNYSILNICTSGVINCDFFCSNETFNTKCRNLIQLLFMA